MRSVIDAFLSPSWRLTEVTMPLSSILVAAPKTAGVHEHEATVANTDDQHETPRKDPVHPARGIANSNDSQINDNANVTGGLPRSGVTRPKSCQT